LKRPGPPDNESTSIFIEAPSGERFEADVPRGTRLSKLAADFFESQGWPMQDARGRGQRTVVELVNPEDPDETKRLNGDDEIKNCGVQDGDTLRVFPESIEGPLEGSNLEFIKYLQGTDFGVLTKQLVAMYQGEHSTRTEYQVLQNMLLSLEAKLVAQHEESLERTKELENKLKEAADTMDDVKDVLGATEEQVGGNEERLAGVEHRIRAVERVLTKTAETLGGRTTEFRSVEGGSPARTVTWLHFSDLHLCQPKTGWDAEHVITTLQADIKRVREESNLRPDLIFFTGDAAFGHLGKDHGHSISSQFDEAIMLFRQIVEGLFPVVPVENVFLVPGNHDVNRNEVPAATTQWLDDLPREPPAGVKTIHEMLRDADKNWQVCMDRLGDYRAFLERAGFHHLLDDPERLLYGVVREIRDVRIGVAGLNSAWSCGRDNEKGKLWMGGRWQIQTVAPKPVDADLKVALMHHPPNWFTEAEDPALNREIERTFHFLLHGHEHQNWVTRVEDRHVRIAAGAGYGSASNESGYNFVRCNLEEGTCEVWLRCYDEAGGGWIPRLIHRKTDTRGMWLLENLEAMNPEHEAQ